MRSAIILSAARAQRSTDQHRYVQRSSTQLQQLGEYDTALLANLLAFVDPTPAHLLYMSNEICSLIPELGPTVGLAMTCELDSSTPDDQTEGNNDGFWTQIAEMESEQAPIVWVVSCVGSRLRHECAMGDGMGKALQAAGCVGVVTNGGVRDLAGLRAIAFAAYGAGATIHHCQLRMRRLAVPVHIGGITVTPGDVMHAGAEGVIRIPAAAVPQLLKQAPQYRAFEHEAHQLLRRTDLSGIQKRDRMRGIREKYGFGNRAASDS